MRASNQSTPTRPVGGGRALLACAIALLLALQEASAHEVSAPTRLDFVPPKPGTYVLQNIMRAPDGTVLDTDAKARKLSGYTTGKVTLLSFIYTTCNDACPLTLAVMHGLKAMIDKTPGLQEKVRFVSLSFDPAHDTPEVMRGYGGGPATNGQGLQWHFLTTRSVKDLLPLLDGFGQDVSVATDANTGKTTRAFTHVLKVFLIDRKGGIREIYTTSFLLPQVMMNDIKTLLLEDGVRVN